VIFDYFDSDQAEGIVLAHTVRLPGKILKKGRVLCADDLVDLRDNGVRRVSGARLEPGDVDEDQAAREVARALAAAGVDVGAPVAGRCYLYARDHGLAQIDAAVVDAINGCNTGIAVATLAENTECLQQQAVASVKVIPFAISRDQLDACLEIARRRPESIGLQAFRPLSAALILTHVAGLKQSLLDSTSRVTHARVRALGGHIESESRCGHTPEQVSRALAEAAATGVDLVMICGANITVDPADIIPRAIAQCGGVVDHFGMPVEPGNMLLLGRIGQCTVINLPGCSRSPKLNGLDWVMQRIAAGVPVGKKDILSMGVGGLVKDISHRWRMREQSNLQEALEFPSRVAAIVLGAGRSSRMGERNKLLATVGGRPMLERVVAAALGSDLVSTAVVTGCEAEAVRELLRAREVTLVHNADYQSGLASSLKVGLATLPEDIDGVMILLADMPFIQPGHINELIAEFNPANERDIVAPIRQGRLGNPIIWAARYLPAMMKLSGDRGARPLLDEFAANVWEVPMGDDAIFLDVDTPQALAEANRRCEEGP
jgi:molybdenum cofactor cytidylyltransferase